MLPGQRITQLVHKYISSQTIPHSCFYTGGQAAEGRLPTSLGAAKAAPSCKIVYVNIYQTNMQICITPLSNCNSYKYYIYFNITWASSA